MKTNQSNITLKSSMTSKDFSVSNTRRIVKNTIVLYFRQILLMFVSLYTVRVVLAALGAEDYGVYNVVCGVVTMFGFLSGAMATASQRFFSFELGCGDIEKLKKTFSVTLCIYLFLILIIFLLAETVGLWFLNKKLVIPAERMVAACWIYQFSFLTFAVTLITAPYMAAIIAHENMNVYAYVSIVEALLKLLVVFVLKILPYDKLIVYGILLFVVGFINTALYRFYCRTHYEECVFKPVWDRIMFKEIFSFTGWAVFGSFCSTIAGQIITILENNFFSPVVAAARAISVQITNTMGVFSHNFSTTLNAPIVKEYAAGRKGEMNSLVLSGCKMTFFLMWIFALPLCLRMDYVLALWLKTIPEYLSRFAVLSIAGVLINSLAWSLQMGIRATGKVMAYEIVLGIFQLSACVASYIILKFFYGDEETVFYALIVLNIASIIARIIFIKLVAGFSVWKFICNVILPVTLILVVSGIPSFLLNKILPQTFISLCAIVVFSFGLSSVTMFSVGISRDMKKKIINKIFRRNENENNKTAI